MILEKMPKVSLLYCTPNIDRNVAAIAKMCYSDVESIDEIHDNLSFDDIDRIVCNLVSKGHLSPLEHASFTFEVSNISRACSHQLVRHRIASYTQQSQRYVDQSDANAIIPLDVFKCNDFTKVYAEAIESSISAYNKLVDLGVKKEDARYVLPEATRTHLIVTMNARELLHFFSCRCCMKAQREIQMVATAMLLLCDEQAPAVFKTAGSPCVRGECKEGDKSCIFYEER